MRFLLLFLIAMLTACGSAVPNVKPFKMDIQQGNVVTSKMLLMLRPGMTKSQVKFIMGTPLVVDSFHTNRWDYFYQMRQAGKVTEKRRVILDFEKDLLARVRGDVVAEGSSEAVKLAKEPVGKVYIKPEAKAKEAGFFDQLKFWDKAEKAPVAPVVPEAAIAAAATVASDAPNPDAPSSTSILAVPMLAAPMANAPAIDAPLTPSTDQPALVAPASAAVESAASAAVESAASAANNTVETVAAPAVEAPAVASTVEPVKLEPVKAEPIKAELNKTQAAKPSTKPVSSNTKPEKLIFRMDTTLDLERGNQLAITAPVLPAAAPTVAPVKAAEPAPPAKETSFFDKMLEKIGF